MTTIYKGQKTPGTYTDSVVPALRIRVRSNGKLRFRSTVGGIGSASKLSLADARAIVRALTM